MAEKDVYDCYLKIRFNYEKFIPSGVCPLDLGLVMGHEIYAGIGSCDGAYQVGQPISGYLIQNPAHEHVSLER